MKVSREFLPSHNDLIGVFGYRKTNSWRSTAMNEIVEKILRKTPLFASLTDKEMEALAGRVSNRRFERGALLFSEGDPCTGLFLVHRAKFGFSSFQ